ncbi:hypothetical protein [Runella zeae]|uniref:hypothetical protein n=1 Tax=Runella zeae TaxID=94255 RepID=UPI00146EF86F|nr:hypothetical protein [Runella zeae]
MVHLIQQGCVVVREDSKGYSVVRNLINFKMSGVPVNNPLRAATVCRICKNLEISLPEGDGLVEANAVIEEAHKYHNPH